MIPQYVRLMLIAASQSNMTNLEYLYIVNDVNHSLYVNPVTPAWQQGTVLLIVKIVEQVHFHFPEIHY